MDRIKSKIKDIVFSLFQNLSLIIIPVLIPLVSTMNLTYGVTLGNASCAGYSQVKTRHARSLDAVFGVGEGMGFCLDGPPFDVFILPHLKEFMPSTME